MSEHQSFGWLDNVAQKWRVLAERRRAHFLDLFRSGRWRHYYGEQQFLLLLRETIQVCERWATIAPPPAEVAATIIDQAVTAANELPAVTDERVALADETTTEQPTPDILQRSAA